MYNVCVYDVYAPNPNPNPNPNHRFVNTMFYEWHVRRCISNLQLRCSWNEYELIKFWGQKVKGQCYKETKYGEIMTWGGILLGVSTWNTPVIKTGPLLKVCRPNSW